MTSAAFSFQPVTVAAVEWQGVSQVSRKQVSAAIVTRAGSWLPWATVVPFEQVALDEGVTAHGKGAVPGDPGPPVVSEADLDHDLSRGCRCG